MVSVKISINLITYNRSKYIEESIGSVLQQSFQDWELIIVDDASTDDTENIIKNYIKQDKRIKYYKNKTNLGIVKSRNLALKKSSGKYIAVLDSDDVWCDKNKLKKQIDFLEKNKDYVLVGGGVVLIDEKGNKIGKIKNKTYNSKIKSNILYKNQISHSSVLFKKKDVLKVGGYDESLKVGEDYDLWLRLGLKGKFANLSENVLKYRIHSGNISSKRRRVAFENNIKIIKKYKKGYKNYYLALFRRKLRYFIYKIISFKK
jgi:glycosyltransferase EpsE